MIGMKVPFFKLTLSAADKRAVRKTLDSGWLTTGPRCAELEQLLCNTTGAKYAVALSSASAGLLVALRVCDIGQGDEVVTTSFTFAATVAAIEQVGATAVLADINPISLNICPQSAAKKVTKRTKAILAVDIAGKPCDYQALKTLSRNHSLKLITDAAHSLGAVYRGKPIGSISDVTVFSFYSTKNITCGEGGALVTNSKRFATRARRLSSHGLSSSTQLRNKTGGWEYDIVEYGMKANLSDTSAALAHSRLLRIELFQRQRQALASFYNKSLRHLAHLIDLPRENEHSVHAWHLYIFKLKPEAWRISRERFIVELQKRGVGCGVHYIPVHQLTHFKNSKLVRGASNRNLPATAKISQSVVTLPLYPELKRSEAAFVCRQIGLIAKKHAR
ncbi:DegT/DnrJ/EryC1/StrS family aminotransferase [Gemmatimonas aurantiaca]|nr:DegT/DnrJ/EryC1/StrS family aminotransferase [Gemmatimonas aurantiaca]